MTKAKPVVLTEDEQRFLGWIAKLTILRGLAGKSRPEIETLPSPPSGALCEGHGAFVTLTTHGHLRGCIGNMVCSDPLYYTVARMAWAAAFEDPRFLPLRAQEWPDTRLDISVIGPLSVCPDAQLVEIGRHGLLLRLRGHSGVFLPQVPVEQGWDRQTYLERLCHKANLPPQSWRHPEADLLWYEAFVFTPRVP